MNNSSLSRSSVISDRSIGSIQGGFDGVFLEVIDEALRYVFKEKTVDLIFQFLKRNNGLSREQIPYNIEEFSSALTDLMGSSAHVLEALVTKFLYFKLQLKYNEPSEIDFTEHMKKLREKLQRIK